MTKIIVPSRRDFLKTSGVAAGAALAGTLVAPSGVYAQADETIKIGLIGCGGRGTGAAGQALSTKGPVKLVAVADAFEDQAHNAVDNLKREHPDRVDVKEDHIFVGFDAYKQVIDSGIDLVVIATSPGFRPIHFEYAVEKGKNVFMEKPVATDAPGIRRLLKANEVAKQKNLKVAVGLQRHHQIAYLETMKQIHDGALGDIAKGELDMLRVYWNDAGVWVRPRRPGQTEMEYQMRNWYYFIWLCGDHINEQHIHNLDVGNWVMQDHPISAYGQGGRQVLTGIDHGQIYDHHYVEFTFKNGTKMISQCRHWPKTHGDVSEHSHGVKGYANISGHQIKLRDGTQWRYRSSSGKDPNPYQVEHDDFFDAVRNNKTYNEADNGAHSTMTALLGRMATYSGNIITWDQAINSDLDLHPVKYDFKADPKELWPDATVRPEPDANGRYWIPTPGVIRAL
jgi:predicted dehydrogenase